MAYITSKEANSQVSATPL